MKKGEKVLSAGDLLGPAELGLLASVGVTQVEVFKKPSLAIISTGNEIVSPGESRKESQIYDSNKTTLLAAAKDEGFHAKDCGICPDRPEDLRKRLQEAAKSADVIITSGGVSMGEKDILKPVLEEAIGAEIHFGRVHMKPGKPTTFATADHSERRTLYFALPGNPVSSLVTFYLFVVPALRKMSGYSNPHLQKIKAKLSFDVSLDPRPEYYRVILKWKEDDNVPVAISTGSQCSSRLLSMRSANGLLVLPGWTDHLTRLQAGTLVDSLVIGRL